MFTYPRRGPTHEIPTLKKCNLSLLFPLARRWQGQPVGSAGLTGWCRALARVRERLSGSWVVEPLDVTCSGAGAKAGAAGGGRTPNPRWAPQSSPWGRQGSPAPGTLGARRPGAEGRVARRRRCPGLSSLVGGPRRCPAAWAGRRGAAASGAVPAPAAGTPPVGKSSGTDKSAAGNPHPPHSRRSSCPFHCLISCFTED